MISLVALLGAAPAHADPITDFLGKFRGKAKPESPSPIPPPVSTAPTAPWDNGARTFPREGQRIMRGFVPDVDRLTLIPGEELEATYFGNTVAGIYISAVHDDQRFVETIGEDGRVTYREGDFSSTGWAKIEGDLLCFYYDEAPTSSNCFYEFRYGDCIVNYSDWRTIENGKPTQPHRWGSVQRFVDTDFAWPDVAASEQDEFLCYAATA